MKNIIHEFKRQKYLSLMVFAIAFRPIVMLLHSLLPSISVAITSLKARFFKLKTKE